MNRVLTILFGISLLAGCQAIVSPGGGGIGPEASEGTPVVNLQVTEYKDAEAFEKIISELEARDIRATVLVKGEFATENCERLRELDDQGFEIMVFARPEPRDGENVTLSMLTYEEQEDLISGTKTAIEDCLGRSVNGFRCTRFDQNEDTYEILDSLGFEYNLGFVAQTDRCLPGHEEDTLPYPAPDYGFWVVPMHSAYHDGQWVAFCDNPFQDRVDAAGWEELLCSELDDMRDQDRALLVEVHPYYSGTDEGRFDAFVSFLDYATQENARFITVAELVAELPDQDEDEDVCEPCQED